MVLSYAFPYHHNYMYFVLVVIIVLLIIGSPFLATLCLLWSVYSCLVQSNQEIMKNN